MACLGAPIVKDFFFDSNVGVDALVDAGGCVEAAEDARMPACSVEGGRPPLPPDPRYREPPMMNRRAGRGATCSRSRW